MSKRKRPMIGEVKLPPTWGQLPAAVSNDLQSISDTQHRVNKAIVRRLNRQEEMLHRICERLGLLEKRVSFSIDKPKGKR